MRTFMYRVLLDMTQYYIYALTDYLQLGMSTAALTQNTHSPWQLQGYCAKIYNLKNVPKIWEFRKILNALHNNLGIVCTTFEMIKGRQSTLMLP